MNHLSDENASDTRLTVLRIAHEILHNQYVEKKMKIHNEWALAAATLWRTQGQKLAYPMLPPYPGATHVVSAAHTLLEFLQTGKVEPVRGEPDPSPSPSEPELEQPEPTQTEQEQTEPEPDVQIEWNQNTNKLIEPESVRTTNTVADATEQDPMLNVGDTERTRLGLLPSWLIRSNRT